MSEPHALLSKARRFLWKLVSDDFLQLDPVRRVDAEGICLESEALIQVGALLRFEAQDAQGQTIAEGTAQVVERQAETILVRPIQVVDRSVAAPIAAASDRSQAISVAKVDEFIVGIDLGTTNTCVSYVVDGHPKIILGRTGGNTIPSVVNFAEPGVVYVGQRAADRQILHPQRTVYGSKRLLGRTYRTELAEELQGHFAFPLGQAPGQRFGVLIDDDVVAMDEISSHILREVRSNAEDQLGRPVRAAVITVPAYFSEVQRDAVRRAAARAELTVHRIVNEPTAAAVAYGHGRGERARVAVWDLGGGTFDFSVVDIENARYQVVATGGDNFVGGADFDDHLASLILERFIEAEQLLDFEPDFQQIGRLQGAAESAKRLLSEQDEHEIRLPEFIRQPRRDLIITVTRDDFEQRVAPLILRTIAIAQGVLLSAEIMPTEIDDVVLVGGSTRIPAVQAAVEELFRRRPSRRINPDEAVALGAGLLAQEIGAHDAPTLLDLLPMTVGTAGEGRQFQPLVKRNARLACETTLVRRADLLGRLLVPLFQGEARDAQHNEYLCTATVDHESLRDALISLRLSFDEHCVMAVEAFHARSGDRLPVVLDRERPLEEVLKELGMYAGPTDDGTWHLPQTRIGKVLGRLARLFRR